MAKQNEALLHPGKQQHNNAKPFPVYVLEIEEVENCYECFKYSA